MRYTTQTKMGPEFVPGIIKTLIFLIAGVSIGSVLLQPIFHHVFNIPGPLDLLTLSLWGVQHYLLWQPVTYLFVYPAEGEGVSIYWLIGLAFNLYIIWIMGSNVLERVGSGPFLRLFLLSGILSGLVGLLMLFLTSSSAILGGPTTALLAILVVWTMINPDSDLLLFFIIPIKSRWLIAGLIGIILFITLSNGDFTSLFYYLTACATGYFYAALAWGLRSPFAATQQFDDYVADMGYRMRKSVSFSKNEKIIPFPNSKQTQRDNLFMDKMLEKISKSGKESLTWWERWRMKRISNRKK
jgi:hypothetical protein